MLKHHALDVNVYNFDYVKMAVPLDRLNPPGEWLLSTHYVGEWAEFRAYIDGIMRPGVLPFWSR